MAVSEDRMYADREKNIPVMRYCGFGCVYCAFHRFLKLSPCERCRNNENHTHTEVLQRTPPKTKLREFLTVGLSGDVSFMGIHDFMDVLTYCEKWKDRTLLIQSKNPTYFIQFSSQIPENVILGTTIETHRDCLSRDMGDETYYHKISKAPHPSLRYKAMSKLNCRKAVTIEPILLFSLDVMVGWIKDIAPEFVYIGYVNDKQEGKKLKLPEPSLAQTRELIVSLRNTGIEVREKTMRKAWWE